VRGLGILALKQGNNGEAELYLKQSLDLAIASHDRVTEAMCLNSLGELFAAQKKYHEARNYYEQSLAIAREVGDRLEEGRALGNLGFLLAAHGREGEASRYYEQSLVILEPIGHVDAAKARQYLEDVRERMQEQNSNPPPSEETPIVPD